MLGTAAMMSRESGEFSGCGTKGVQYEKRKGRDASVIPLQATGHPVSTTCAVAEGYGSHLGRETSISRAMTADLHYSP